MGGVWERESERDRGRETEEERGEREREEEREEERLRGRERERERERERGGGAEGNVCVCVCKRHITHIYLHPEHKPQRFQHTLQIHPWTTRRKGKRWETTIQNQCEPHSRSNSHRTDLQRAFLNTR